MIILYSLLMLLVPTALGFILWQCYRAHRLLKIESELRLKQLRRFSRHLRIQRQSMQDLHTQVNQLKLPLPAGQTWWVLNAIFKVMKVRQMRNMAFLSVPHAAPRNTTPMLNS